MVYYDRDEIHSRLTGYDVADYLGMDIQKRSGRTTVLCPASDHNDTHFGNCKVDEKGCYCFACNRFFNLESMVMEYKNVSFVAALDVLAGIAGVNGVEKKNPPKKFPFSDEEMELIGIYSKPVDGIVKNVKKRESICRRDRNGDYLITKRLANNPAKEMWKNDPETFWMIVSEKIGERLAEVTNAIHDWTELSGDYALATAESGLDADELRDAFLRMREKLIRISEKADAARKAA